MDIQEAREAFERRQAKALNVPYEGLKARFDENSRLFGARYNAGSINEKEWNLWLEAWQAKTQAVPEWISVKNSLPPENTLVLGMSQTPCNIFNIYNVMALDEFQESDITHWMPLPDAPQEPTND